uniref:Uncharacterized protein n=1 Tax=Wuchereria bancrofti TaxID=6293 RepID=A0AAF5Q5Q7_WUCBA
MLLTSLIIGYDHLRLAKRDAVDLFDNRQMSTNCNNVNKLSYMEDECRINHFLCDIGTFCPRIQFPTYFDFSDITSRYTTLHHTTTSRHDTTAYRATHVRLGRYLPLLHSQMHKDICIRVILKQL